MTSLHYPECNERCAGDSHYMDNTPDDSLLRALSATARAYVNAQQVSRRAFPSSATELEAVMSEAVKEEEFLAVLDRAEEYLAEDDEQLPELPDEESAPRYPAGDPMAGQRRDLPF